LYKSIYVGIHFYVFELLHIVSDIGYVLTYFRFPRDPYKRKIWLNLLITSITPSRLPNIPTKKRMRKAHKREITMLRRQLYSARQQVRYKKKIETFDTILQSLKKKNLLN